MRKSRSHLPQMRVKPVIFALVVPSSGDFAGGITEDRTKLMLNPHSVAECIFNLIDPSLRDVRPNAQNVREICNLDCAHGFLQAISAPSICALDDDLPERE